MNIDGIELRDQLAAEYALGTMTGKVRDRFERMLERDILLRKSVEDWQGRLNPLVHGLPPIKPPARIWRRIKREVRKNREAGLSLWQRVIFWRVLGLGAAALAVVLTVHQLTLPRPAAFPNFVAVLTDQESVPAWYLQVNRISGELSVKAVAVPPIESGKDHELWLLPAGGKPPESMGLLPKTGSTILRLDPAQLPRIPVALGLAVSVEPSGGSPTGAPTGPVIMQAKIHSI